MLQKLTKKKYASLIALFLLAFLFLSPYVSYAASTADDSPGLLSGIGIVANFFVGGVGKIAQSAFEILILPVASWVLAFTGSLLDAAIKFSLGSGYIFSNITAINATWVTIRDICNLFFIFSLIWISISTIINVGSYNAKRKLTQVIVAALIINFSLYFTKVIIDASNLFGNWLYSGILNLLQANQASSLSALISSKLGILFYWSGSYLAHAVNLLDPSTGVVSAIVRLLVVLTATYVFMYTAILFITRAVTIIFLLALSPIGFIGELFPKIEYYSKQWWSELTDAATFPIAYLMMLYITLQFINNMENQGLFTSVSGAIDNSSSLTLSYGLDMGQLFKYVIVISMLFACLKVAKDASGQLGKAAGSIAEGMSKAATVVGGKAAALTGQYTIGAAAAGLAKNTRLNELIAGGGVKGALAYAAKSNLETAADFHFDPRAALSIGVKPGKGYKTRMKEEAKDQEEALKEIAPTKEETAAAKSELDAAEKDTYLAHPEYGVSYAHYLEQVNSNQAGIATLRDARATAVANGQRTEGIDTQINNLIITRNKNKRDLDDTKNLIRTDEDAKTTDENGNTTPWRFDEQLFNAQGNKLRDIETQLAAPDLSEEERKELKEKQSAIKAARRQEGAIQEAGQGILVGAARNISERSKNSGLAKKILSVATGASILNLAAKQIVSDNKKLTKGLRKVKAEPEKKKQQEKIEGILARAAEGGAAPAPAQPNPPAEGNPTP